MALPTSKYHLHLNTDVQATSFLDSAGGPQINVRISAGIAARIEGEAVLRTEYTLPTDVLFSIEYPKGSHSLRILLAPILPQRDESFLYSRFLLNYSGPELVVHYWYFRMEGWQHLRSNMVTVRSGAPILENTLYSMSHLRNKDKASQRLGSESVEEGHVNITESVD